MRRYCSTPHPAGARAIFCGAAHEIVLNQWFLHLRGKGAGAAEGGGDLLGMCGFAAMLGLARLLYGLYGSKIDISRVLTLGAAVSVVCYLTVALSPLRRALNVAACAVCGFAAGLLWPGTLVLASERFPWRGGVAVRGAGGGGRHRGFAFPPG